MASTISSQLGRDIDATAVVTGDVVEEVEEGDEKGPIRESRRHSTTSSRRTENDDSSNEPRNVEALQTTTTNSEPWSVFSTSQKRYIVLMVAMAGFFSPLSGKCYGLEQLCSHR